MKKILYSTEKQNTSKLIKTVIMGSLLLVGFLASIPSKAEVSLDKSTTDTCILCHKELDARLAGPVKGMTTDIHAQAGLSCADCHGGDATIGFKELDYNLSMDKKKGYVGKPKPSEIPQFCAKCHGNADYMKKFNPTIRTDQLIQYRTSVHGKLNAKGDIKVAQCINCHGIHGIMAVKDSQSPVYPSNVPKTCAKCHANADYMKPYNIPTDQFEKYQKSVHGIALLQKGDVRSAPACNSCHGNHGAAPPTVSSVIYACGQCHTQNEELFNSSPHKAAFEKNKLGACDACHGHHDVHPTSETMVGTQTDSICIKCHKAGDKGFEAAGQIATGFNEIKSNIKSAETETNKTAQYGRDVSIAKQKIKEAQDAIIVARTIVHTVSLDKFNKVLSPAKAATQEAIKADKEATQDLSYRYIGLISFIIVAFIVAILLYLKVRQMEK